MKPRFFATTARFRAWLERNHDTAAELWVGFHRKGSGKPSITWPEAVDQALCFGWIDGIRKRVDHTSYMNRFTPRKPTSTWSDRNVKRARELIELGLMAPAGLRAFEARRDNRIGIYSYEQRPQELPATYARPFRANARAWKTWRAMPPGYRKAATWWVISAKREETRERRLATLIETTARGERIPALTPPDRR
ncbi:MAG: YdeI/OmpD-associated family protein [Actinomycetota bacterium]